MRWNWPSDEAIFGSLLTLESAWRRKPLAVVGVTSSNHITNPESSHHRTVSQLTGIYPGFHGGIGPEKSACRQEIKH
jgi:hypothetical protein